MIVLAKDKYYKDLNEEIKNVFKNDSEVMLDYVEGQRYLGVGMDKGKKLKIYGTPGNDMACYMNGGSIEVFGNAQDAVGNTMNGGQIIIRGNAGDALGYAMRDGEIYIDGNVGYRCGIHMKEFGEKKPVIVIGGCAGSYLGEYMAGGIILLIGQGAGKDGPIQDYCATGMHGGIIYIRGEFNGEKLSKEVKAEECFSEDLDIIGQYMRKYCSYFDADFDVLMKEKFTKLRAASARPYKNLYARN